MRVLSTLLSIGMLTIISTSYAYADSYKCVGMDATGNKINVLYDEATHTVNINGQVLKIEAGTKGKNGVATENYETVDGDEVYASLVVEEDDKILLRQYDASNDKELAVVPLACE